MLLYLWLNLSVVCKDPEFTPEKSKWSERDLKTVESAKEGCKRIYSKDHCLIKIKRTGENSFWAICKKGDMVK